MQEIWQEVSENKSIYSRLWSFGVRSLRFRECGLYEASDLLLGDHLTEKSATVKWIDVSMPHKRNRRLKDQSVIEIPRTSLRIVFTQTRLCCLVNIWRDSVVYDELTINERQKSDAEFATMLDCVRRGCPTDETICCLEKKSCTGFCFRQVQ